MSNKSSLATTIKEVEIIRQFAKTRNLPIGVFGTIDYICELLKDYCQRKRGVFTGGTKSKPDLISGSLIIRIGRRVLIQADAKALEWVVINWLAQDPVGMEEIISGVDVHSINQERFGLPERVIAKIFVFRLIYGGTEYSYANDPDFMGVSKSQKFWKDVIEKFYTKYKGIATKHADWMREAVATGGIVMPTGREYLFNPYQNKRGETQWPRTKILNYPVQGLAADLMAIARVSLKKRLDALDISVRRNIKLVSTVHDSIVGDISSELLETVEKIITDVFRDLPSNFSSIFGVDFNLPLRCEITSGPNLKELN